MFALYDMQFTSELLNACNSDSLLGCFGVYNNLFIELYLQICIFLIFCS